MLGALLVPGPLLAGASGLLFGTLTGFFVTLGGVRRVRADRRCAIGARAATPLAASATRRWRRDGAATTACCRSCVQRLAPVVPDGPFNYAFGVAGVAALAARRSAR